ncbi:2'-5' RNA ligase family protein [Azotobacter vinelandii]
MNVKNLRLFFGLPLPHRQAEAIDRWRRELGLDGRPVARRNLHLTLAFSRQPSARAPGGTAMLGRRHSGKCFRNEAGSPGNRPSRPRLPGHRPGTGGPAAARRGTAAATAWRRLRPRRACILAASHTGPGLPQSPAPRQPPDFRWRAERFVLFHSTSDAQGTLYRPLFHWPLVMPER